MSRGSVRFVHANDLQLGAPLFGLGGLSYSLRQVVAEARYRSAQRVFDAALEFEVDFVLLTGAALSPTSPGPRGAWFLAGQFERLRQRGIPVYWINESPAAGRWPEYLPLPANVHSTDPQAQQTFKHSRGDRIIARITTGAEHAFQQDSSPVPLIAALPEGLDGLPLSPAGVDYWALGNRSAPGQIPSVCGVAEFAGTIQGYAPTETGPRGCLLVTIDETRKCDSRFLETNAVRWHEEQVHVSEQMTWKNLCDELLRRQNQVVAQAVCDLVVFRWTLMGRGIVWQQLRRESVCRQLQSLLIRSARGSRPVAWSLALNLQPDPDQLSTWSRDESPFGEAAGFIRDVQRREKRTVPTRPYFDRATTRSAIRRLAEMRQGRQSSHSVNAKQ